MIDLNKMGVVEIPLERQREISGGFMWGLVFLVALVTVVLLDVFD